MGHAKGTKETSHLAGSHLRELRISGSLIKMSHLAGFLEETTPESSYPFAEKYVGFLTKYGYII